MAATPKKLVHWALDMSKSPQFGSPITEGNSTDSCSTSSSLPYINAQLIAHGFTHQPGLSVEGMGKEDSERVVKCLLAMLSQRIDDMSRTEDLTTKLRTLSYDHERLMTMYRTSTDKATNAEKEMNLHKSRLTSVNRTLQSAENAHKQTTAELQRTRTALQAVRTAHQTEIKKLEKEKEKFTEKWSKMADTQLSNSRSGNAVGFRCANSDVVEASEVHLRGKGKGLLETALEQAEQDRNELIDENMRLKSVIVSAANELQRMLYGTQSLMTPEHLEEPSVLTMAAMFPFAPATTPSDKLSDLMSGIKQCIEQLAGPDAQLYTSGPVQRVDQAREDEERSSAREVARLQNIVNNLRSELEDAQTQSKTYAAEVQQMFERFAKEQNHTLVTARKADSEAVAEETDRLEQRAHELEEERRKFTEAAVVLGREKAALEAERIEFLEEKRAWQVQTMLSDFQPSPAPGPGEAGPSTSFLDHIPPEESPRQPSPSPRRPSPRRPARKSRSSASAVVSGRSTRRSSVPHKDKVKDKVKAQVKGKGKEKASSSRIIPPFETEVIPPSPSRVLPAFKTNMTMSQPQAPKIKPPAFVLPPPSPAAQLPPKESLLSTRLPKLDLSSIPSGQQYSGSSSLPDAQFDVPMAVDPPPAGPSNPKPDVPQTPSRRPFPVAKPLAPHMVHAYSPVKPSPLSRILMLNNSSPDSPEARLGPLHEEEEDEEMEMQPAFRPISLAAELGLSDEDEDDERRGKPMDIEALHPPRPTSSLGRYPTTTTRDKGKVKAAPTREPEKKKQKRKSLTVTAPLNVTSKVIGGGVTKRTTRSSTKASVSSSSSSSSKPPVPSSSKAAPKPKAGPRRVPIGSAEAAPARAWRG